MSTADSRAPQVWHDNPYENARFGPSLRTEKTATRSSPASGSTKAPRPRRTKQVNYTGSPTFPARPTPQHFPTSVSNDGRIAWLMGFAALMMVPYGALLIPSVLMLIVGYIHRSRNPVARAVTAGAIRFAYFNLVIMAATVILMVASGLSSTDSMGQPSSTKMALDVISFFLVAYIVLIGPAIAVIRAIIAAASPVSPDKAYRILSRSV